MADVAAKADGLIRDNAVMIFSKTTCPYCSRAKKILQAKRDEYEAKGTPFTLGVYEINLDQAQGPAMQDYLAERSGERTVPRIFVAGTPLSAKARKSSDVEEELEKGGGGCSDLEESMGSGAGRSLDGHWLKEAVKYTATLQG